MFLSSDRSMYSIRFRGPGTGKTHLAVSIARTCIRAGRRSKFLDVVDLLKTLDAEARAERQGRSAGLIYCLGSLLLDELGYLPFARNKCQRLFHLISMLYERTPITLTTKLAFCKRLSVFGGAKMTPPPLLDRRTHHYEIVETGSESPALRKPCIALNCNALRPPAPLLLERGTMQRPDCAAQRASNLKCRLTVCANRPTRLARCLDVYMTCT